MRGHVLLGVSTLILVLSAGVLSWYTRKRVPPLAIALGIDAVLVWLFMLDYFLLDPSYPGEVWRAALDAVWFPVFAFGEVALLTAALAAIPFGISRALSPTNKLGRTMIWAPSTLIWLVGVYFLVGVISREVFHDCWWYQDGHACRLLP